MSWAAICDECGFEFRSDELRKRWDGAMVCWKDWEPRHPQELQNTRAADKQSVPWSRPEPEDVFLAASITDRDTL